MSITALPQHVYVVTTREFGEQFDGDGEHSIVSIHGSLELANVAAKSIADAEVPDQGEINFDEGYYTDGGRFYSWRDDDIGAPGMQIEVCQWQLEDPIVTEMAVFRPERHLFGDMITIPKGRPLLRGAKFMIMAELQSMSKDTVKLAIETYRGEVVDSLTEADYVVVSATLGITDQLWANSRYDVERIDEAKLFAFIELGIPPQKVLRGDRVQDISSTTSSPVPRPPLAEIRSQLPRPSYDVQALARLGGAGQENYCGPPAKRPRM